MRLTYRMLWVEDEREFIESLDSDKFRNFIELQGFDLDIEYRTSPQQIRAAIDGANYDLLIVDYNIAEGDFDGADLIRNVRSANCLTEVIFYSQKSVKELRAAAAEKELEGVFFASRDSSQLIRKVEDVFSLTVRKVVDLENMRGIVMAGVADLDHLVSDVIRAIHCKMDEGSQVALCRKLLEKMRPVVKHLRALVRDQDHESFPRIEELIDSIVSLDPSDLEALISARSFDSSRRVDMLLTLSKGNDRLGRHKEEFKSMKGLLEWRNALAHQKPIGVASDGSPVFVLNSGHASFDANQRLALRKELRAYQQRLKEVLDAVNAD